MQFLRGVVNKMRTMLKSFNAKTIRKVATDGVERELLQTRK